MRIFLFTILGTCLAYLIYSSHFENTIFDVFGILLILLISIVIFFISLRKDYLSFQITKKYNSFISTFTGVLFVLINIGIIACFNYIDNKPSLLKAKNEDESLDFKIDGTLSVYNGNAFAQSRYYSTYTIHDSIFEIKEILNHPKRKLMIVTKAIINRNYANEHDTVDINLLLPISSSGGLIANLNSYKITEHNGVKIN